jgi:mannose-6-phosphate isomerase-like protein (cupin superfamily)
MIYYSLPKQNTDREREGFSAIDITLPTTAANVSEINLTRRYPETGFALNRQSEMFVRIIEGSTIFHCEGEKILLPSGSTVLVQTNKPYCWIPQGTVRLYVVSTPPWTPDQHESVAG